MNLYFFYAYKDGHPCNRLVAATNPEEAVQLYLPLVDRIESGWLLPDEECNLAEPAIFPEHANEGAQLSFMAGIFEKVL